MSETGTSAERDAEYEALACIAALRDDVRRWQVFTGVLALVLFAVVGSWAWGMRDSAVERDLRRQARVAVAAWESTLERAGLGKLSDTDLERAGVDPDGLSIRELTDEITSFSDHAKSSIEVTYQVDSIDVHPHGVVNVAASLSYEFSFDPMDPTAISGGGEGRYLTFVETDNGLRLVRDVFDGNGHLPFTSPVGHLRHVMDH